MKKYRIFFSIPVQGKRLDDEIYKCFVDCINKHNGSILNLNVMEPPSLEETLKYNPNEIYNDLIAKLKTAELLIAEISSPSLGVGYEIAFAQKLSVPILLLFNSKVKRTVSLMIRGINYNNLKIAEYNHFIEIDELIKSAIFNLSQNY